MADARPICYLDVGGVVYYAPAMMRYQSRPRNELRPHLIAFLKTIHDCGYELRLLSGDPAAAAALTSLLSGLFSEDFPSWDLRAIPNVYAVKEYERSPRSPHLHKAAFVELDRPFIWIEDCINPNDAKFLEEKGWKDRLCEVSPFQPDELLRVKAWIREHPFSRRAFSVTALRPRGESVSEK